MIPGFTADTALQPAIRHSGLRAPRRTIGRDVSPQLDAVSFFDPFGFWWTTSGASGKPITIGGTSGGVNWDKYNECVARCSERRSKCESTPKRCDDLQQLCTDGCWKSARVPG
jgi:hypothetical protein